MSSTNGERRAVAAHLRQIADGVTPLEFHVPGAMLYAFGFPPGYGSDLLFIEYLADLIEPPKASCYYYEPNTNHCRCYNVDMIDRDKLLSIVKEMESFREPGCGECNITCYYDIGGGIYDCFNSWMREFAKKIREAIGMPDD